MARQSESQSLNNLGILPDRLMGSGHDVGYGPIVPVAVGAGLSLANGILSATGELGDLEDAPALSVLGNSTNAVASYSPITAASDHQVLRRSGTSVAFGAINLASSNAVTGRLPVANFVQGSALSVMGVASNATANIASIAASLDGQILRRSGTTLGFGALDLSNPNAITGSLAASNLANGDGLSVLGVTGSASANYADITSTADNQVLRRSGTSLTFGAINLASTNAVTGRLPFSNISQGTAYSIPAVAGSVTANYAPIAASDGQVLRRSGTTLGFGTIDLGNPSTVTGNLGLSNLAQGTGLSVLGVAGSATADYANITAASDNQVLRRSGTTLGFGAINLASTSAVTGRLPFSNQAQGSGLSVAGVSGSTTADFASISAASDNQVLRRSGTTLGFGAINLASANAVSGRLLLSNVEQGTGLSVLGVAGSSTANYADITAGVDGYVLRRSGTSLSFGVVPNAAISGTYDGITVKANGANTIYSDVSSGSTNSSARYVTHAVQYRNSVSTTTGAIVFVMPNTNSTRMYQFHVRGMLYNNSIVNFIIQGYRTTGAWSATKKTNLGQLSVQTRFAVTPDGKNCLILGDVDTVWSYPHITVDVMMSHSVSDADCTGWTTGLLTSLTGYTQLTSSIVDDGIMSNIIALADSGVSTTPTTLERGAGGALLATVTSKGYILIGPQNTSFCHIDTDRPLFYFNRDIQVNGSTVWHSGNDGSGSGLDADLLDNYNLDFGSTVNTVAGRNGSGDISARLFRATFANQSTISGALAFRVNNGADNYIRFCSDVEAIKTWLGVSSGGSGMNKEIQTFTSSGTSTVPAWAKLAYVTVVGGGGSGAGAGSGTASGGGASAAIVRLPLIIEGLSSIGVTVGAGGAVQTTNGANGNRGGTSWISLGTNRNYLSFGGWGATYNSTSIAAAQVPHLSNGGTSSAFDSELLKYAHQPGAWSLDGGQNSLFSVINDTVANEGGYGYGGRAGSFSTDGSAGGPGFVMIEYEG